MADWQPEQITFPQGSVVDQGSGPIVVSTTQGDNYVQQGLKTLSQLQGTPVPAPGTPGSIKYDPNNPYNLDASGAPLPGTGNYSGGNTSSGTQQNNPYVSFINPTTGQSQDKITADSLTPETLKSLQDQGYQISESSGNVPSWILSGGQSKAQAELDSATTDFNSLKSQLSKFMVSDADLQNTIQGITAQWDARIEDMKKINSSRDAAIQTTGIRIGSRYTGGAGGVFGGIVAEEERQGVMRIGQLEAQKQAAIAAAKEAARSKNWDVFSKQLAFAETAYKDKLDAVNELNKQAVESSKKAKEAAIQASRDSAIADLVGQGITDPGTLLNLLNFDQKGKQVGDFTLKQITDSLKSLIPAGLDDVVKTAAQNGAPADVLRAIMSSPNLTAAYGAAGDYIQAGTGIVGEYQYYVRQAKAAGQAPVDFNTYQNIDANRKAKIAAAGVGDTGLSNATLTKVQNIAGQFDGEAIVKNYNTIAEQINFIQTLGTLPTDDIARVYAFAKVMDPNSVVRETEYKTVQDYSTALLERMGLRANRVFNNEGFLTDEARKFLSTTLETRLKASQKTYDNVAGEYARRINKITGKTDGKDYITDYTKGYGATGNQIINQESQSADKIAAWIASDVNNSTKYSQMVQEHPEWSDSDIAQILGIQK